MIEKAKSFIKSAFPGTVEIYRHFREAWQSLHTRRDSIEGIFSGIHQDNLWADPESVSGWGSTLPRTDAIRRTLPTLLESVGAKLQEEQLRVPARDHTHERAGE